MIIASNGIKTFVFERVADDGMSLSLFHARESFSGICLEVVTYPSETGNNTVLVNPASAANVNSAVSICICQPKLSEMLWYQEISAETEIFKKVRKLCYPEELNDTKAPEIDAAKIANLKNLLAGLTEAEVKVLTGK